MHVGACRRVCEKRVIVCVHHGGTTCAWALWSKTTVWVNIVRTDVSFYGTCHIKLIHSFLRFVDLVKLWPPQAPKSAIFSSDQRCWELRNTFLFEISTSKWSENGFGKLMEHRFRVLLVILGFMASHFLKSSPWRRRRWSRELYLYSSFLEYVKNG